MSGEYFNFWTLITMFSYTQGTLCLGFPILQKASYKSTALHFALTNLDFAALAG